MNLFRKLRGIRQAIEVTWHAFRFLELPHYQKLVSHPLFKDKIWGAGTKLKIRFLV